MARAVRLEDRRRTRAVPGSDGELGRRVAILEAPLSGLGLLAGGGRGGRLRNDGGRRAPHRISRPLHRVVHLYAVVLAAVFVLWQRTEKTLSIRTIDTPCREAFYWAVVVATFAMGTAVGDLTATTFHLGYGLSIVLFAGIILIPAVGYRLLRGTRSSPSGSPTSSLDRSVLPSPTGSANPPASAVSAGVTDGSAWCSRSSSPAWSPAWSSHTRTCRASGVRCKNHGERVTSRVGSGRQHRALGQASL
jgi:hypothetical protein